MVNLYFKNSYPLLFLSFYVRVYVCMHMYLCVSVCICMYLQISCKGFAYTHVCGLTDDRMSSHFLANNSRIAAQKYWKWGHVWACIPLADFVHFTAVDFPKLALLACRIYLFKPSVLLSSKAG